MYSRCDKAERLHLLHRAESQVTEAKQIEIPERKLYVFHLTVMQVPTIIAYLTVQFKYDLYYKHVNI